MKNIEEETNSFLFKTKLLVRVTFSKWRKIVSIFKQGNFDLDVVYTFLMLKKTLKAKIFLVSACKYAL